MRKRVMIVGAGASGRGHVGELAFESGYDVAFADKDERLCDELSKSGAYTVSLVGHPDAAVTVTLGPVVHTGDAESFYRLFAEAPLVLTSVCPPNLPDVAAMMRRHIIRWLAESPTESRKDVMCCENMASGSTRFGQMILEGLPPKLLAQFGERIGFPDAMISRVVTRPTDALHLSGEAYSEWTAERSAFRGELPQIKTLELVDGQERYLGRKLYIHNTGHAVFGYLGFRRGKKYIHEAANDPEIMELCRKSIEESGWAVEKEYGFSKEAIEAYRNLLTDKCISDKLPDDIVRVVRDPLRKLGPDERFFGPIALMLKHGRQPELILHAVAAALLSEIPGDNQSAQLRSLMETGGVDAVLRKLDVRVPPTVVTRIRGIMDRMERDPAEL